MTRDKSNRDEDKSDNAGERGEVGRGRGMGQQQKKHRKYATLILRSEYRLKCKDDTCCGSNIRVYDREKKDAGKISKTRCKQKHMPAIQDVASDKRKLSRKIKYAPGIQIAKHNVRTTTKIRQKRQKKKCFIDSNKKGDPARLWC